MAAVEIIAMHGWAGDARAWEPWRAAAERRSWSWRSGERGYGDRPPRMPTWGGEGPRLLISHSMGIHLVPKTLLEQAQIVVLLAGFGRFVPPGPPGRPLRVALAGMARQLREGSDPAGAGRVAQVTMRRFLAQAASPEPETLLPPGPADRPVAAAGLVRLRQDLDLLARCEALPEGFPAGARVHIVEAASDRIVVPAARALLRCELPLAVVTPLAGAGHALLRPPVLPLVFNWLETNLG